MPRRKREITLEELARLTQEGFKAVDSRFAAVDASFEAVDAKLARLESKMATKSDLRESEERLLQAISGNEVRRPDFEALQHDVEDLSGRVKSLEKGR
jgi:hypothetical protein